MAIARSAAPMARTGSAADGDPSVLSEVVSVLNLSGLSWVRIAPLAVCMGGYVATPDWPAGRSPRLRALAGTAPNLSRC